MAAKHRGEELIVDADGTVRFARNDALKQSPLDSINKTEKGLKYIWVDQLTTGGTDRCISELDKLRSIIWSETSNEHLKCVSIPSERKLSGNEVAQSFVEAYRFYLKECYKMHTIENKKVTEADESECEDMAQRYAGDTLQSLRPDATYTDGCLNGLCGFRASWSGHKTLECKQLPISLAVKGTGSADLSDFLSGTCHTYLNCKTDPSLSLLSCIPITHGRMPKNQIHINGTGDAETFYPPTLNMEGKNETTPSNRNVGSDHKLGFYASLIFLAMMFNGFLIAGMATKRALRTRRRETIHDPEPINESAMIRNKISTDEVNRPDSHIGMVSANEEKEAYFDAVSEMEVATGLSV